MLQHNGTAVAARRAENGVRFLPRPAKRLPFLRRGRAKRLLLRPAAPFITRGLLITKYYGVIFYESVEVCLSGVAERATQRAGPRRLLRGEVFFEEVSPVEWWDAHWLTDRIARKLGRAFPFSG